MISLNVIFGILIIHWIADFVCQTDWQAKNKSTNNIALLTHTITYSIVMAFLASWGIFLHLVITKETITISWNLIYWFIPITFVAHTITDYYTSRLNSYLWKKDDVHNFFVSVGFDQVLHYTQLILTYIFLL